MADPLARRQAASRRAFLAALACAGTSSALGRTPYGGRLRLAVPWPISALDPALLNDGFSALFASAAFDPLYGLDASGVPYPTLADGLPSAAPEGAKVRLRPGLKTAAGRALGGADVLFTIARARGRGASGVLGELAAPLLDPKDPLNVVFPGAAPEGVALALASPLLALVPRGFSALSPDGTGAFRVKLGGDRALLTRNLNAARGAAYLDAVEVSSASDIADLLRGFESGATDVGWFGAGLYRSGKEAVGFESPRYGFAVLRPGASVASWGAPGTLQALLDGVPAQQLAHLGLRGLPSSPGSALRWGGRPSSIAVLGGAPQLVAVARALASTLSSSGHELTVSEKSAAELSALRESRQFELLVDCVRAGSGAREVELLLRTAASPEAAKRAPKTASLEPRLLGRQLALGVIGELSVHGARRAGLLGLEGWQLGAVSLRPSG